MRLLFSNAQASRGGPAIFIDRDGVINERKPGDYVLDWSEFVFVPGIRQALKELAFLGFPLIVISNQSAVGRGLLDLDVLEIITRRMHESLLNEGTLISAVYYCTHRPEDRCACRKPRPELLRKAAADFGIDLSRSIFIGDSDADVRAAEAAGCRPLLLGPGLTACSETCGWINGLSVAASAGGLFRVAAELLNNDAKLPQS